MSIIPASHNTVPSIFIIESLKLDEEEKKFYEGKFLYDYLSMLGKNPIYYYIRTETELNNVSDIFRKSGYRYLFLSCHGSNTGLHTTFDSITFKKFSEIFNKKLEHRRLFVSGCSLGRIEFANEIFNTNGGMYTLTAPTVDVRFEQALPFWTAFFYLMESMGRDSMKSRTLKGCML